MKKLQGIMLAGILVFLAAAGFFWWAFLAPAGTVFQLVDRNRDQVVLSVPVKAGDKLSLEIEHSFEHIPWYEYYTVTEDFQFNLDAIAVAGYGAGIPAEMDVPTRIETFAFRSLPDASRIRGEIIKRWGYLSDV